MLPEFPNLQIDLSTLVREFVIAKKRQLLGGLGDIQSHHVFEGHQNSITRENGENELTEMAEGHAEIRIPFDEFPNLELEQLLEKFEAIAQQLAQAQADYMFATIAKGTAKVGNNVDAGGQKFSADLYLKVLEKLWIDFEPNGKPKIPTLHISPQMQEAVKEVLENLHHDPKLKGRFEKIVDQKQEEWRVREASRELAG